MNEAAAFDALLRIAQPPLKLALQRAIPQGAPPGSCGGSRRRRGARNRRANPRAA